MTDRSRRTRATRRLRAAAPTPVLGASTYRHVDRASKLLGVGLVAAGLDAGGATPVGFLLGAVGTAIALSTVFIERRQS